MWTKMSPLGEPPAGTPYELRLVPLASPENETVWVRGARVTWKTERR